MTESPYAALLGLRAETDGAGHRIAVLDPGETSFGRPGVMHGGAIAALLRHAGMLVLSDALARSGAEGVRLTTVSITVDYLRPGPMARSYARGRIVKLGARVANIAVEAWSEDPQKSFAIAKMTIGIERE